MEHSFLIAQIIGFIAFAASVTKMQLKSSKNIFFCDVPICLLWAIQFYLLGAFTGAFLNIIASIRSIAICYAPELGFKYIVLGFFVIASILTLNFMGNWYDILPLIANALFSRSLLQRNNRELIVRIMFINGFLWFTYNLLVASWMGMACASFINASILISMIRYEGLFVALNFLTPREVFATIRQL